MAASAAFAIIALETTHKMGKVSPYKPNVGVFVGSSA